MHKSEGMDGENPTALRGASEEPGEEVELVDDADSTEGMTLLEHLEEVRWTIAKSLIALGLGCVLVMVFLTAFARLLLWPYEFATRGYEHVTMEGLINTSFLGVFSVIFQLMLIGGLGLALPVILYFFGSFVAPGLTPAEKRMLRPGCAAALGLFLLGATFSFFVLLPAGLRASVVFNDMLGFQLFVTASSYYGLLTFAVLGVGLAFELPLIIVLCIYIGILNTDQLRRFRRYSIVLFLVLAAIITPTPDPITFLFLAVPMSLLYETAIYLGSKVERRRAEREAAEGW